MGVITRENGKIITWKVWVFISGTTVENMKANIKMIKSTASVFIPGLMVDVMKDIGGRVSSTVLVHMLFQKMKR